MKRLKLTKPKPASAFHSKPVRDFVLIRARDDLDPNSDTYGLQPDGLPLIVSNFRTKSTALPDTMGVVEVLGIGPDVKQLKIGDIAVIDMNTILREFNTAGAGDQFVAREEDFRVLIDSNGDLHPLPNFVLTRMNEARMRTALMGDPSFLVPPHVITSGFVCRWTSAQLIYDRAEATLGLSECPDWRRRLGMKVRKPTEIPAFHMTYEEVVELGENCKGKGLEVGDLTTVTTEFSEKFVVRGTTYRLSDLGTSCHGVIDDAAILADAKARKQSTAIQPSLIII